MEESSRRYEREYREAEHLHLADNIFIKKSLSSINYKRGGNSPRKQAKQLIAAALPAIYFGGFFLVLFQEMKRGKRSNNSSKKDKVKK